MLGEVLLVNEVSEPAEGTGAVDCPHQLSPKLSLSLPLGEVSHHFGHLDVQRRPKRTGC